MKALIKKEIISIFCSATGLVFSLVFLIASGLMLWFFEGSFNIPDGGYATLDKFFSLAPILFIILIPALTMRLIAEEKKNGTFNLLRSRPLSLSQIWFSKWIATFILVTLVIISTIIYVYTIYSLGNPTGNIDLNIVITSYIALILLAGIFISVGLFASALTSNQITAFIIALGLNFLIFYGFDLLSTAFPSGNMQSMIVSFGLSSHFKQVQRGVIESGNLAPLVFYVVLPWILSLCVLNQKKKLSKKELIITFCSLCLICLITFILPHFRFDLTKDKRYTITDFSRNLMNEIKNDNSVKIKIDVYLEGNFNSSFRKLSNSIADLLSDLNKYAGNKIDVIFTDPASLPLSREQLPEYMASRNMPGILLNEVDRDGKVSRQLIYPYAQVISEGDTLQIPLLKNSIGNTAEENLNASAEDLEFQFVDALRLLVKNEEVNIAFIEGHGELSRAYIYDAEEALAKYFYVNRGQIGNDISILDNFKVVIIAGATQKFTETEKYILDQYLMKGGNILWLLDGVYVSHEDLANKGYSASIKNEINLDDLLFTYGVRIQPVLLQDSQSASIVISAGEGSQPTTIPWYYSPLLLPSPDNVITRYISDVKAEFVSSINLLPNKSEKINSHVLLSTSQHSRIISVPENVDFDIRKIQSDPQYFNDSFLPVAASLEGEFRSAFENRAVPDSIIPANYKTSIQGKNARMIVAASSNIIRNDIIGQGENTQVIPLGFDRISGRQYGNRDFIVNAVNWLADGNSMSALRNKSQRMNLLNKQKIYTDRNKYAIINTLIPLLFVSLILGLTYLWRKRKYEK